MKKSLIGQRRSNLSSNNCKELEGFPGGSVEKNLLPHTGDLGSVPGLGRSPGGGKDDPFQYSCLGILWTEEPGGLHSMR